MARRGRQHWLEEDTSVFADETLYRTVPADAWRRLKGFARPVLQEKMVADGTIDQDALGKLAQAEVTPVVLTQEQVTKASDYLTANWSIELP